MSRTDISCARRAQPRAPLWRLMTLLLVLAGCAEVPQPATAPPPPAAATAVETAPSGAARPEMAPTAARSPESRAMSAYYAQLERKLRARGLLRTERDPKDAPFDARLLARDFSKIAFFDEYPPWRQGEARTGGETPDRLRRWAAPVRLSLIFGPSIPAAERLKDRLYVTDYAAYLAQTAGHPITTERSGGNFNVLVLNELERRRAAPLLRQLVPGITDPVVRAITDMPPSTYCLVFAFSQPGRYTYDRAIAVVRGEHPDLMRRACYEEEIAQGLGPGNDSPAARPSIFNDDQEFALLTRHDALILRMLYDPRLRPGMTASQATPIVEHIANSLVAPHS